MMAKSTRGERLQLMLTPQELTVLDDFRFKTRMPSRAAAIRELLRRGLSAEGYEAAGFGAKSEDFGVTDGPVVRDGGDHTGGSESGDSGR